MSERATIHRPVTEHLAMKPTGVLMVRLAGETGFMNLGNYESVSFSMEKEEEDIWSPQTPIRSKVGTIVNEISATLSFELNQLTAGFRSVAMQSQRGLVLRQQAVAKAPFEIVDFEAGRIVPIGYRDVTEVKIEGYEENKHFQVDRLTGNLEIIAHPDGKPRGKVAGTVSAAAIDGWSLHGIMSDMDIRGSAMFRSTNLYGPLQLVEFWDVQLSPTDEVTLGSNSADLGSISFEGSIFADPRREGAFEYGRVTDLPRR